MYTKANEDIRNAAKRAGVPLWKIAEKLGIRDSDLSRKLRRELPEWEKKEILQIINSEALGETKPETIKLSRADEFRKMISTEDGLVAFLEEVKGSLSHQWCGYYQKCTYTDEEVTDGECCENCMRKWLRDSTPDGMDILDTLTR